MSLIFPYRPFIEVNDFYESFQDNYEPTEGFGRHVSGNLHLKTLNKIPSARDAQSMMGYENNTRKCFSTQSFQENECEMQNYYSKPHFAYCLEDHSTKGSFSSMTSMNSFTSVPSVANAGNVVPVANNNNCSKKGTRGSANKKKVVADKDYRIKYKTEPCKYFTEKGYCEYGDQCAFAHGTGEIRQKAHISSNYKTKKCNQFHEMGYCPYGVRCQFIHSLRKDCQFNRVLEKISYTEAMENPELWITHDPDCICMQSKTRRRFPSFQQVSASESSADVSREESNSLEKTIENLLETSM